MAGLWRKWKASGVVFWVASWCWLPVQAGPSPGNGLLQQAERLIQGEDFSAAEVLLRKALQAAPKDMEARYRLAYVQFRQRKLDQARRNFSLIVRAAPPAYYSRYFLGRIALLEGRPAEAAHWLKAIHDAGERIFDSTARLAEAYLKAGQTSQAVPILQAAIQEAPWDAALYYQLGQAYQRLNQPELAQDAYDTSRRLRTAQQEEVQLLLRVDEAAQKRNREDALRAGRQILERQESSPAVLVALGVLWGHGGLTEEALTAFEEAARRDANLFQAQYNRGLALLKLNRPREARRALERAVQLLPQSAEANTSLGLACVLSGDYQAALAPLERARAAQPQDVRLAALLATAWLRSGEAKKAVAVLRPLVDKQVHDAAPLLLLIEALNAAEDPEGALAIAKQAQQRFPGVVQAQLAVAQQLARLGRYQEARPAWEAALKLAPGLPEAELGLAEALQKAGEHQEAAEHYQTALQGAPQMLAARLGLARSLTAIGRLAEAQRVLEQGLALHGNDVPLRAELSRVYARLGRADLAAEQAKIIEQLQNTSRVP
jgi:tetratricopeptide (TPR) repeat protein